ncbi:hypothetical protein IWQ61_010452, partial [Dispira simplex]
MYHIWNQHAASNLVRAISISPKAVMLVVKVVPEEVIEVPTEWDCLVVMDGKTYQVKRSLKEEDKIVKKVIIKKE